MYCHIWSGISFERMGLYLQLKCVCEWQGQRSIRNFNTQYADVCSMWSLNALSLKATLKFSSLIRIFFLRLAVKKKSVLKSIVCLSGSDVSVSCNRSNLQSTCVLYPWARCYASSDWQLFATLCYSYVQNTCLRFSVSAICAQILTALRLHRCESLGG